MSWRVADSIRVAFEEANRLWPERRKSSDGTIGDARHSARRSDHNPDARGIVHAFDLTHDPENGVDCGKLRLLILGRRDHRLRYLIWNREITFGPHADSVKRGDKAAWSTEPYRGPNPHTKHLHVSVGYDSACENDRASWWVAPPKPPTPVGGGKLGSRVLRLLQPPMSGPDVAHLQRFLGIRDDGIFGPRTHDKLVAYQRMRGLKPDGIFGPETAKHVL